jgi:uncharacterized protein YfaS (alpha-2-macroglobulin family)
MNPQTLVAIIVAACCFFGGVLTEGWRKDGQIARLERAHAEQRAAEIQQHLDDITEAEALGRRLSAKLAAAEAARETLTQEKTDAIRRLTVGRPCLDSAAVRVLNDTAGLKPAGLPPTASQPVSADAAFATDTDVGLWAAQARRAYDTCRGRLQAIADFYGEIE